jgi:hypothetical protein
MPKMFDILLLGFLLPGSLSAMRGGTCLAQKREHAQAKRKEQDRKVSESHRGHSPMRRVTPSTDRLCCGSSKASTQRFNENRQSPGKARAANQSNREWPTINLENR